MGCAAISENYLPFLVSGDSVLHAVHRSYDKILQNVEEAAQVSALKSMLTNIRGALGQEKDSGAWPPETVLEVDQYLGVMPSAGAGLGPNPAA
jgi:hypothetical protein